MRIDVILFVIGGNNVLVQSFPAATTTTATIGKGGMEYGAR